jgi:hypothetical protein
VRFNGRFEERCQSRCVAPTRWLCQRFVKTLLGSRELVNGVSKAVRSLRIESILDLDIRCASFRLKGRRNNERSAMALGVHGESYFLEACREHRAFWEWSLA